MISWMWLIPMVLIGVAIGVMSLIIFTLSSRTDGWPAPVPTSFRLPSGSEVDKYKCVLSWDGHAWATRNINYLLSDPKRYSLWMPVPPKPDEKQDTK